MSSNTGQETLLFFLFAIVLQTAGAAQDDESKVWLKRVELGGNATLHCNAEKYNNQHLSWSENNSNATIITRDETGKITHLCDNCKVQGTFNLVLMNYTDTKQGCYRCMVIFPNETMKLLDTYKVITKAYVDIEYTVRQEPGVVIYGNEMKFAIMYNISGGKIQKVTVKEGRCENTETLYQERIFCYPQGPGLCYAQIANVTRKKASTEHCVFFHFRLTDLNDQFKGKLPEINAVSNTTKVTAKIPSAVSDATRTTPRPYTTPSAGEKTVDVTPSQIPNTSGTQLIANQLITCILLLLGLLGMVKD